MRYLVDTNVLLRSVEDNHPMRDAAVSDLVRLRRLILATFQSKALP
ncbi:hypothetical protein [Leptolyngbya ohadii]|nr:hypothetical protein [Leptolyngbya ohadii]